MAARDLFHDSVIAALQKDGWTITHDPLYIDYDSHGLYVDIGATRDTIGAIRGQDLIAVEVKSFAGRSAVADAQKAIGQYDMYESVLADIEPERVIYLAVPSTAYQDFFTKRLGQRLIEHRKLRLIIYDEFKADIVIWINWHGIGK
ncbi:hypothetical protein GGR92_003222 [Spirosoma lacussanchae]|uniref:element excision factor XisH family protein n=1 Tax=Spirosoma lacussanchae TaxID=1884249 RepID=UPI0011080671|nr:element excision factor XisH family protein [Spirosoma lacussanchae]